MPKAIRREFVGITDQALDALWQRIGQRSEHTLEPWCYEATRDNIRHYAHGIGDDNPLWCDPCAPHLLYLSAAQGILAFIDRVA